MGTKTITILDDVYEMLEKRKLHKESFSDAIRRTMKRRDIMELAGAWSDMRREEIAAMKRAIKKHGDSATKRMKRPAS